MKKHYFLFISLFLLVIGGGAAFYFFKKKEDDVTVPVPDSSTAPGVPDRISTIQKMNSYVDMIFQKNDNVNTSVDKTWNDNVESYKKIAKQWVTSMYTWCLEKQNGWSFESQQEAADKNGYSLPLQMVQSICWQLYYNGTYSGAVWDYYQKNKIFEIAAAGK